MTQPGERVADGPIAVSGDVRCPAGHLWVGTFPRPNEPIAKCPTPGCMQAIIPADRYTEALGELTEPEREFVDRWWRVALDVPEHEHEHEWVLIAGQGWHKWSNGTGTLWKREAEWACVCGAFLTTRQDGPSGTYLEEARARPGRVVGP